MTIGPAGRDSRPQQAPRATRGRFRAASRRPTGTSGACASRPSCTTEGRATCISAGPFPPPAAARSEGRPAPVAALILALVVPAALLATACGRVESAVSPASPAGPAPEAASSGNRSGEGPAPGGAKPVLDAGGDEAVVRAGPVEDLFLLTGELSAVRSLELITPRSESWRLQIKGLVEDGSEVKEGDPIVEFDNTSVAQTIEEKRLARIQTEIDLESRQASLSADGEEKHFGVQRADIAYQRAKAEAAVPPDLMSRRDWQEKQAALRQADAALEKARLDLRAFETASRAEIENLKIARDKATREIEAAQATLEALSMKAPKAGIVVISENWNEDRKYQVGDNVWPGLTVATIPDLGRMETVGYLSDVDDGRIAPGMKVRSVLDTYPGRVFGGKVEEVASIADARRGFRVRISIDSSDPAIMRPGMSVRAEVVRRTWDRALLIPRQAVHRRSDGTFVAKAGGADPVPVEIASCTPIDCVIESGLTEGDRVRLR